jgi:desulfoferrodoxin (superoxide reductase-like protein)
MSINHNKGRRHHMAWLEMVLVDNREPFAHDDDDLTNVLSLHDNA